MVRDANGANPSWNMSMNAADYYISTILIQQEINRGTAGANGNNWIGGAVKQLYLYELR